MHETTRIRICHRLLWSLLLGLATLPVLQAQASAAEALIAQGDAIWLAAWPDSALAVYEQAMPLAETPAEQVRVWYRIGKCYTRQADLEMGRIWLDSTLARTDEVGALFPEILLARTEKANLLAFTGALEKGLDVVRATVQEAQALPPSADTLRAELLHRLSIFFIYNQRLDSAQFYCDLALALRQRVYPAHHIYLAHTYNSLGSIHSDRDENEAARQDYETALEIMKAVARPGHTHTIQMQTNLAVVYRSLSLNWEAQALYDEMLPYLDQLPPDARFILLMHYASSLESIGEYHKALRYIADAEQIYIEHPYVHPSGASWIAFEKSGIYYSIEDDDQALQLIRKAINNLERDSPEGRRSWILYCIREGIILLNGEQYQAAIAAFKRPLAVPAAQWPTGYDQRGWLLEYLGQAYAADGQTRRALLTFREALNTYTEGGNPWNNISVHFKIAATWRSMAQWDSTFRYHRLAWQQCLPELPFQLAPEQQTLLPFWHRPDLPEMLEVQGLSLEKRFRATGDSSDWRGAIACYESYLTIVNETRRYYVHPSSRRYGVKSQLPVYERLVNLLTQGTPSQAQIWRALTFSAQSKASNLRQHLQEQMALKVAGVPDSLLRQELAYNQRLLALDQRSASEGPTDSLRSTRVALYQNYQALIQQIESRYPAYYQLKFVDQKLEPARLQAHLADHTTMYSYFSGEQSLFIFRVSQGIVRVYKRKMEADFHTNLADWLYFVSHPPGPQVDLQKMGEAGLFLRAALLPDLPAADQTLFIVPQGQLALLPFESLPNQSRLNSDLRNWAFLGGNYAVRYAYAEALSLGIAARPAEGAAYLGFAPDFEGSVPQSYRDALGPLAFNQQEVSQAAELLGGKALKGAAAQEAVLKSLDNRPYILHFATHAMADSITPLQARIFLEANADASEDGLLHAYEIYAAQWKSPLTVLSACQTGLGRVESGEGIMSLARAFQYAGSEQVLTTLWKTDDQAGAALTQTFFGELAHDQPTHLALKKARQQWLQEADAYRAHPFFWAGYILIGDGSAVKLPRSVPWTWRLWGVILLSGLGLVGWRWYQKQKSEG